MKNETTNKERLILRSMGHYSGIKKYNNTFITSYKLKRQKEAEQVNNARELAGLVTTTSMNLKTPEQTIFGKALHDHFWGSEGKSTKTLLNGFRKLSKTLDFKRTSPTDVITHPHEVSNELVYHIITSVSLHPKEYLMAHRLLEDHFMANPEKAKQLLDKIRKLRK